MWWLHYVRRLSLDSDKEFRLRGTLIHLAMAYHYASQMEVKPSWFYEKDLHTALEEKGAGLPDGIQKAKEAMLAYREEFAEIPWNPLHIEEEFTVKLSEIDPMIHDDIKNARDPETRRELEMLAELDDEIVSCRPDLIIGIHGTLDRFIIDHKSVGQAWGKYRKGLEKWNENGKYALDWQILVNLHVVRRRMPNVKGFIIQRITRAPDKEGRYYFDQNVVKVPAIAYERAPRMMRKRVLHERALRQKIARGERPDQNFWACWGQYGECDYRPLCRAGSAEEQARIFATRYVEEESSKPSFA